MLSSLNQVQLGHESAWNTAQDTPSVKLMTVENCKLVPQVDAIAFDERRGSLAPAFNSALSQVGGTANIDAVATYEDIGYYLEALFAAPTPTGSSTYTRAYAAPLTGLPACRSKSLYYGQGSNAYRLIGALVTQLTLSGESNKAMMVGSQWGGSRVVPGTLGGALTDRAVNVAMGHQAKLYIDAWAGILGATEIASTQWAWQLTVNPNRVFDYNLGQLGPYSWHDGDEKKRWGGELKLSLEVNATSSAWLNTLLAASPAQLQLQTRIKYSDTANRDIAIDFCGVCLKAPETFSDNNGLMTFDLTLSGLYHTTVANWLQVTTINSLATLA